MRHPRLPLVTLLVLSLASAARADSVEDGRRLMADGRAAEAAAAFGKALEAAPANRAALLGLAGAVTEAKMSDRYEDVAKGLRAALKAKPDDREARLALGFLYLAWVDVDERYRADVQEQFGELLRVNPDDEEAVVGMARMYYAQADSPRGLAALDAFLGRKPGTGLALYWKGFLLYDQGEQAYVRAEQRWSDEIQDLFQKAYDALDASTKADPKRYDAWMRLGYAAQRLIAKDETKRAAAVAAYEKALDVDGDQEPAMRGLSMLYARDASGWAEVLARLAKDHPKASIVRFYRGFQLQQAGRLEEAEKEYRAYVAASNRPAIGWYQVGAVLEARGDEEGARKAYVESLRADSRHARATQAVDALAKPLYARMTKEVAADKEKARALLADCRALMDLVPTNLWLRNNVGVFFRDSFVGTKDVETLKGAVKAYEEAAALVGPWRSSYEGMAYKDRHQMAQVLNDTGLMFQYHKPVEDLKKAEAYYRLAMDWSENGYGDAYGNWIKILEGAGRWQEAYDLATACAEGLKNEDGTPNETGRATARGDAEKYAKKLPK